VSRQPPVLLEPVTHDQSAVLNNLFELYAHDFSEYVPLDLKPSGRFDVTVGEQWWARDDHFPFFIRSVGKLCGFALVRRGSRVTGADQVMDVAEFFVVRGARGKHVGTSAARALFDRFPGRWEIRARQANPPAIRFWARMLAAWLGHEVASSGYSCDGVDWEVFKVDSPATRLGDEAGP